MIFQKIKYYDSIEILPLYNFDKYRSTKDLNWFIVGYDGRQKKLNNEKLKEIETSIIDQYFKAVNDLSFLSRLKKWAEIEALNTKYFIVKSLVKRLWLGFADGQMDRRISMIRELKVHGFIMQEINTLEGDKESLILINNGADGIKTQIHILEKELLVQGKKESVSLAKEMQIVTIGLGYPHPLDAKKISLLTWIELTKLLEENSKKK